MALIWLLWRLGSGVWSEGPAVHQPRGPGGLDALLTAAVIVFGGVAARGWGPKAFHVYLGLALNFFGLLILMIANS